LYLLKGKLKNPSAQRRKDDIQTNLDVVRITSAGLMRFPAAGCLGRHLLTKWMLPYGALFVNTKAAAGKRTSPGKASE
jgi:hypothetical protein